MSSSISRATRLIAARRMTGGRRDLGPADGYHIKFDQPNAGAELQHLAEQPGDLRLVTDAEPAIVA